MKHFVFCLRPAILALAFCPFLNLNAQRIGVSTDFFRDVGGKIGLSCEYALTKNLSLMAGGERLNYQFDGPLSWLISFDFPLSPEMNWNIRGNRGFGGLRFYCSKNHQALAGSHLDMSLVVANFEVQLHETIPVLLGNNQEKWWSPTRFRQVGGNFRFGWQINFDNFRLNPTLGFALYRTRPVGNSLQTADLLPASKLPEHLRHSTLLAGFGVGMAF